jgi:hypothetical protein
MVSSSHVPKKVSKKVSPPIPEHSVAHGYSLGMQSQVVVQIHRQGEMAVTVRMWAHSWLSDIGNLVNILHTGDSLRVYSDIRDQRAPVWEYVVEGRVRWHTPGP